LARVDLARRRGALDPALSDTYEELAAVFVLRPCALAHPRTPTPPKHPAMLSKNLSLKQVTAQSPPKLSKHRNFTTPKSTTSNTSLKILAVTAVWAGQK